MKTFSANGFSLMELMIVIGIFGILVAIAIPSYQTYTRKAHYVEIIQAANPYKLGVEECFQILNELANCKSGENGVPPNISGVHGMGLVSSITVDNNGVITITPQAKYGITAQDTYVLTPTVEHGMLVWSRSGGAITAGYAH